jgi:ferredoxin-thioredoxin reductase catalytic subunit
MPERGKKTFDEALAGTKRMSEKYVERGPFQFFPESEVVEEVQKGLAQLEVEHGYRYCP